MLIPKDLTKPTSARVKLQTFKPPKKREVVLHGAIFTVVLFAVVYSAGSLEVSSTADKITQASQMILQFDSFLAGGWIVGFFFFWGNFGKEVRELRRLSYRSKARTTKDLGEYFKVESWEEDALSIGTPVFALLIFGIANIIASGILAVVSVLSSNGVLLVASLGALVLGTWVMLESWYAVHGFSNTLGAAFDKLNAFLENPASSAQE